MKVRILACALVLSGASLPLAVHAAGGPGASQPQQPEPMHGHGMPGHGTMPGAMQGAMPGMAGAQSSVADRLAAATVDASLAVSDCWIRSLPAPAPSGGYFTLRNKGEKPAKLLAAASPAYGMVMLHRTTNEGGMSRMSETPEVLVEAGGTLAFEPGGYHLMLGHAPTAPAIGSKIDLELLFEGGLKAVTQCEIKPANTRVP